MVDPAPLIRTEKLVEHACEIVAAMKLGDQQTQESFIREGLFLPLDDGTEIDRVLTEMLATPLHVATAALESVLAFDGIGMASRCKVPALHIAAALPLNPHHQMERLLEGVVSAQTVGAGHFSQLLVPIQVNDMINRFAQHHVWS